MPGTDFGISYPKPYYTQRTRMILGGIKRAEIKISTTVTVADFPFQKNGRI